MKTRNFVIIFTILFVRIGYGQMNTIKTSEKSELKADSLYRNFKYDSASVFYSKAAELYEKQADWLACVKNYRLTGNALLKAAKYDTALYFTHKALTLAETHFRESNRDEMFEKSDVFLKIADVNEQKGKFDEELTFCKKALELTLKTDSLDSLKIAYIWNKTGAAYTNLRNYVSALQFCDSALDLRIKLLGEENIDVAESNFNIGRIYLIKGESDKALEYYQKALKIRIVVLGEQNPAIANIYFYIGTIYKNKGENDKALEYNEKALNINIATLGEQHPIIANNYGNIGIVYYNKGEYDKALDYYQKAFKISIATLGEQNLNVAYIYGNIGITFDDKGEYDKALEYYQKALKIIIPALGEQHPVVAISYNNIGAAYNEKGEYDKALEYYQKALNIYIAAWDEQHPFVAECFINIGIVYKNEGEYDKAMEYIQKAFKIRVTVLGEQHPEVANNYINIGEIYRYKEEYDKALEYYQKALKIYISAWGEQHPYIAECYNNMGEVDVKKGEFMKSIQNFQKALLANLESLNDTSIYSNPKFENALSKKTLLISLIGKADALYQLYRNKTISNYDMEVSLSTYESAFQLINNMRNECNIENTKLLLSDRTKNYYAQAAHVAMIYNKVNSTQEYDRKAFEFVEKGKSATMAARFNEYNAQHISGIPDSLLTLEKELRIRFGNFTTQIVNLKYQKDGYDTLKVNTLENENFTCSRKLDSLISFFETTYPIYYEFKYANKIASVPEIQKALSHNTLMLNYFVGDSILFIAVISDSLFIIKEITVDSSFKKLVTSYYKDIKTVETESFVTNSQQIYEKLIKPVKEYISCKEHLIIIPDDYLYYVPFETIIDNASSSKIQNEDYSKLNYLIKAHSITYHHSATLWYNSRKRGVEPATRQNTNFIGFAPIFSKEKNNGVILSCNINAIDTTGNNLAYRTISSDLKSFNPLPYSKDEITSIVHLFEKRRKEAKAYLYSEASEENFKNNISNYNFIHISSHGFSNDKEPDLSGIIFSQSIDTSEKEDGILYTGEAYNLNLNADLIVLSSCESGLGKLIKGEGLQALSRGFLYAGAPNVIFSLWKALDKPTSDLMVQFYTDLLDGKTYAESLRLAKLKLINDPKTAFPHFWGGFVIVGR